MNTLTSDAWGGELALALFRNFLVPTTATCIIAHGHGGPPNHELKQIEPTHLDGELDHFYRPKYLSAPGLWANKLRTRANVYEST